MLNQFLIWFNPVSSLMLDFAPALFDHEASCAHSPSFQSVQSTSSAWRRETSFDKEEKCLKAPSVNDYDDVEACKNGKSSGKSLKLAFLFIICKSSGNPSNWDSPFFKTVPDGRTDGRTNEQTYPLIDLLAAGKNQSLFINTVLESDCSYMNVLETHEPLMDNRDLDCHRVWKLHLLKQHHTWISNCSEVWKSC